MRDQNYKNLKTEKEGIQILRSLQLVLQSPLQSKRRTYMRF